MSVFYHVTFLSRVPTIENEGLVLGKRRIWSNSFGAKLGKSALYLFNDPTMAVRWAHKMQYEFDRKTVILVIDNPPGNVVSDDHIEAQMNGNSWFYTDESIPPSCIRKVIPLTLELTREVVKTGSVTLDEEVLEEGRDAPLYHFMDYEKTVDVFFNDCMYANWLHDIPAVGRLKGNSMSRNAKLDFSRPVRLTLDQTRLAQTNRIIPLDGEGVFRRIVSSLGTIEVRDRKINKAAQLLAEEFVIGDITPLHKYITQIDITGRNNGLSGNESVNLLKLLTGYSEKYSIPLSVAPSFQNFVDETLERWREYDEEDSEPELVEMAPADDMRSSTFYHGTGGTGNAKSIMKTGLRGRETQGKGYLAPLAGRAYLSQNLRYAIIYALGGDYLGDAPPKFAVEGGDPYGYVFVVKGDQLETLQPDEDSVGEFLYNYTHKSEEEKADDPQAREIANFIANTVTEKQRQAIIDGEYIYFAAGGKRALKIMPDWIKQYLIRDGAHVAATGKLMPSEVWRIDRRQSGKLANDGSNFFQVAKRIK